MARKSNSVAEEKKKLASSICNELAQAGSYTKTSGAMKTLEEMLRRTRSTTLSQLSIIVSTINIEKEKSDDDSFEWVPPVPAKLSPLDIEMPESTSGMKQQMDDLHGMSVRLSDAWENGDIEAIKRFHDCIGRVLRNLSTMVKAQLWNNIK